MEVLGKEREWEQAARELRGEDGAPLGEMNGGGREGRGGREFTTE